MQNKAVADIEVKVDGEDVKITHTGNAAGLLCAAIALVQSAAEQTGSTADTMLAALIATTRMGGVKNITTAQGKGVRSE